MSLDFLKQDEMRKAPHPPYSPDLAPSDFHLFNQIKQLLAGHEFPDRAALLGAVQYILWSIEKISLDHVFLVWMERPEQCITINGDYVE
jgi:histone-lysine N-methyltransferase SETMAR